MNPKYEPASMIGSVIGATCLPVSYIWLMLLGEWSLIGWAIFVSFVWMFLAGWINRPSRILKADPDSRIRLAIAHIWAQASHVITMLAVVYCFFHVAQIANPTNYIPVLMVGFVAVTCAMYPIIEKNMDDTTGYDTWLNAQVLYAALVVCYLTQAAVETAAYIVIGLTLLKPIWMILYSVSVRLQRR